MRRGRALCEEAVAIARRADDQRAVLATLWVQNEINWGPANLEARLASSTAIASLAESIGDYQRALRAQEMRFTALLEMGDIPALDEEVQAYTTLAEKSGEQFGIVHIPWNVRICDHVQDDMFSPGQFRDNEWGGEYGPYQISRYSKGVDGEWSQIWFTMSTWNPYQSMLMTARITSDLI